MPTGGALVVGVSGGPDSLCLLHLLKRLMPARNTRLHVAHLDHGIRGEEATADARFVEQLASEWGLAFSSARADVPAIARSHRLTMEEAARCARYSFLALTALSVGAQHIAVAHNADDQAETVLMHWLRGSGLPGLRGMLPATPLSEYRLLEDWHRWAESADIKPPPDLRNPQDLTLIRPLLAVARSEIEAYCDQHNLEPRTDSSNLDTTYYRNRLRHELIPYLETYNPNIREVLRRTADVVAADYDILRRQLGQAWQTVVRNESHQAVTFDLAGWQALPLGLKRSTIREAIHRLRHQLRNINFVHVEDAVAVASTGETGNQAMLPHGLMLNVGYDSFTISECDFKDLPHLPLLLDVERLEVQVPGATPLPDTSWTLYADLTEKPAAPDVVAATVDKQGRQWDVVLDADIVGSRPFLRRRQVGDLFHPLGLDGHSKRVNEFMINEKIPAGWRRHVPLLVTAAGEITWVCGWRIDHRARVTPYTRRYLHLRFQSEL